MIDTLDRLAQQDHPDFEVIVIVGDDDPATEFAVRQAAELYQGILKLAIDDSAVKNRSTALNCGLSIARGDVVGSFNVGDEVNPLLLRRIDSRLSETAADVVQGGVQLMNFTSSWWSLRTVLENYFWFRSELHLHTRSRFVPLTDSSAFVKRNWLEWASGWDEFSVDADAELGARLSSGGATTATAYIPDLATRRDNPAGIRTLVAERTRADLGSLQILGKQDWRNLPKASQRHFARYQLMAPFVKALTAVLIPLLILAALVLAVPAVIGIIVLVPLAISLVKLSVEVTGLSDFARLYGRRARPLDYLRLILGAFPYQMVLAVAALNAIITGFEKDYSLAESSRSGIRPQVPATDRDHVGAAR